MCIQRIADTAICRTVLRIKGQRVCCSLYPGDCVHGGVLSDLACTVHPEQIQQPTSAVPRPGAHPALWGLAAAILLQPSSLAAAHAAGNSATAGSPLTRCTCSLQPLRHTTPQASEHAATMQWSRASTASTQQKCIQNSMRARNRACRYCRLACPWQPW